MHQSFCFPVVHICVHLLCMLDVKVHKECILCNTTTAEGCVKVQVTLSAMFASSLTLSVITRGFAPAAEK